jgi:hypothetical protein
MDEWKNDQLSVKEWAVALPLIGAALAVTYDVGFFYGIGLYYFTLFSLSEHILFALQVIPAAFAAAFMIPSGTLGFRMGVRAAEDGTPPIPTDKTDLATLQLLQEKVRAYHRRSQKYLLFYSCLFIASGVVGIILKFYFFGATMFILGLSGAAGYLTPRMILKSYYVVLWYVAVFMVMSVFLGFQIARGTLEAQTPSNTILTASIGTLHGVLIRGGDRGVLFYETVTKTVRFLIWADIKSIESKN